MIKVTTETKPTLKSIEKSLDKNQVLTTDNQCDVKGGCSSCEDNRRPPRVNGGIFGWLNN
ncbi:MAG: hypothetical protein JNL70_13810 [Saprospiraceae bacterium]|nr:hypothetical protein [Saprospiraceae bacterium]